MSGRGAWNVGGVGGTKKYKDATKPGPYYYLGTGKNVDLEDPNQYAVYSAVKAYQKALNRRLDINLTVDGVFGPVTSEQVLKFQRAHPETGTPWGGIGPQSSESLLLPDLKRVWRNNAVAELPLTVCTGTIRKESLWDAGAVGFTDPDDVGLAQINADAHPEWSVDDRLKPVISFRFVVDYHNENIDFFNGELRDAIAAYNLGKGGTLRWISQGRPEWYTPAGQTKPRNVWAYIDTILKG